MKTDNNGMTHGRGYVYNIQYHIVWCTKYRKQVLQNGVDVTMKTILEKLSKEYKFTITELEVMPDHVHMLLQCKPHFYIPDMVKILKGTGARKLLVKHPEIKRQLWGGHLWNPSYFVSTVSDRTTEAVREYINKQKIK